MKLLRISGVAVLSLLIAFGCKKPSEGYLSKVLVYNPKTLNAVKGRVTTSAALLVDGSTNPINVKLLAVRNYYTKQPADSILLKKYEIATYKAEITQQDTTAEQIAAKISKDMYPSFNINPIGGRIEVTPATNFIDTGTYEFDIQVSNPAGSRVVNNVGIVKIVNPTTTYDITAQSVSTSPTTSETFTTQTNFTTSIVRTSGTENKIILKFVDKNGTPFNPNAGNIIPRADRPTFRTYDPFYPEVKTDTALVYQYPPNLPTFPIYSNVVVAGSNWSYVYYFRIPAAFTDINLNLNPLIGFRLWPVAGQNSVSGTYVVTFKMNFVTKKP
jgi:hypothetical protein